MLRPAGEAPRDGLWLPRGGKRNIHSGAADRDRNIVRHDTVHIFFQCQQGHGEINNILRNGFALNLAVGIAFAALLYLCAPGTCPPAALGQSEKQTSRAGGALSAHSEVFR